MKFINVILTFKNGIQKSITIESLDGLHELDIYNILVKLFPCNISINYDDRDKQEGYSYTYKNDLHSVAIFRAN